MTRQNKPKCLDWLIFGWTAAFMLLVLIADPWVLVIVGVPLAHYLLWGRALSREAAEERRWLELAAEIEKAPLTIELDRSPGDERIREPREHIVAPVIRKASPRRT